jgi:outer membrane protein
VVGCLAGYESSAQKKWTLQECLDFAKLNNLAAQQSQVTKDKALVQLNTARSQFLPRVEFRARTIGNWGFIIDPSTNVLADRFNLGNQAALNVNLDLFNGFANHYQIKQRVKELEATRYGYESTLNNISLEVTYSYLQVLLAHEQWKNSQQRLGNLDTQQKQVTAQVQKGVLSKRDLLNLKSLIASEELLSVSAENSKERTLFELMQVMGLVNGEPIQIDTLNIPDLRFAIEVSQEDVLSAAADVLPDLKAARSKVEAARYSWRVARTNYAPSLYLGGQVATRTSNYKPESFDDQLVSNLNQQIGIYLNVPIFNRFAFRNSIGMAKLDIVSSQLSFQQIDVELKRKVISAYLSYKAAARKYQALVIQFEALIEENRYAERMLQLGSMNAIEYSLIRSRMVSTQSDLLQAKYDYFFRNKILDFYQGKPLSF